MSGFEIYRSFRGDVADGVILTGIDTAVIERVLNSIRSGDAAALSEVVRRFPDCLAHEVQDGGTRAVHLAAGAGGGAEVLNELIRAGVDTSIGNNFGETPLHLAARDRAGGVERVELLLRSGCDPRAVDILGQTPLHAAAKALNLGAVRPLVEHGVDVDARNMFGATALHLCAGAPDLVDAGAAVAAALVDLGADLDALDDRDDTALHKAAGSPTPRALHLGPGVAGVLLGEGKTSSTNPAVLPACARARNRAKCTPLEVAIKHHNPAVVAALLRAGAGHAALTRLLLRKHPRIPEPLSASPEFWMARELAEQRGNGTVLDLFLAAGFDLLCTPKLLLTIAGFSSVAAAAGRARVEPPSLQALCRARIRRTLGASNIIAIDSLPIPRQCKQVLVFNYPVLCPAPRVVSIQTTDRRVDQ